MPELLYANNNRRGHVAVQCAPLTGRVYVSQEHQGKPTNDDFLLGDVKSVSRHDLGEFLLGTKIEFDGSREPLLIRGIDPKAIQSALKQARTRHQEAVQCAVRSVNPLNICQAVGAGTLELATLLKQVAQTAFNGVSHKEKQASITERQRRLRLTTKYLVTLNPPPAP